MNADWLLKNIHIASMDPDKSAPYGAIYRGAIAVKGKTIVWVGSTTEIPKINAKKIIDGQEQWITPGLIDCHTHLIYAGNRAEEFELRLQGKSYEEISRQGGGINSTVKATRHSSEENLFLSAANRLKRLAAEGVTTLESKSGYGLDLQNELKILRVNQQLQQESPIKIKSTFLGLHALPTNYIDRSDEYVQQVCNEILPIIAKQKLADAVDVFCENIAFSPDQCRQFFEKAKTLGFAIKGHVEQLSHQGGARLIAEFDGLSADHIEYLQMDDIDYLKTKDVTVVILPTAFYYLNETQHPPIQALRDANLNIAIATDHNPGSAPSLSLLTAMNQACVLFGLTPEEALTGTTRNGAKALGLEQSKGQLTTGFDADLLLWDINHPSELSYGINMKHPKSIWIEGHGINKHTNTHC